jgi:two-component system cell cycle sensor histidine kinase/response regulator CckA
MSKAGQMNVDEALGVGWSDAQADCRRVFEGNSEPMWVVDLSEVVDVNRAAVLHYGYSRDEFIAMTVDEIGSPGEPDTKTGERPRLVGQHRKKDGALIDVEVTSFAVTFRGRPALLTSALDVTYRRRTEAQTRSLELLLAPFTDQAIASAVAESTYGRRADEVLGPPDALGFRSDVVCVERAEAIQRLRETGRFHGELTHRRADGRCVCIESRAAALFDGAGNRFGYVSVNRDITER